MAYFWFWILVLFVVLALLGLPAWPYSRGRWNYGPSGAAIIVALLVLIAFWFGFLAIWWPWAPGFYY